MDAVNSMEIENLIMNIKNNALIEIEQMQTVLDALVLAAEQVQDKRIELLENGPEVACTDIFLDLALCFILESPVAAKAIKFALKGVVKSVLRSHTFARLLAGEQYKARQALKNAYKAEREFLKFTKEIREAMRQEYGVRDYLSYRRWVVNFFRKHDEDIVETFTGAAKTLKEWWKSPKPPSPIDATNSPGVGVLKAVQSYISQTRHMINAEAIIKEAALRMFEIDREGYSVFADSIKVEPVNFHASEYYDGLEGFHEMLMYQFEILIWAKLCKFNLEKIERSQWPFKSEYYIAGKDKRLLSYFMRRFSDFINNEIENNSELRKEIENLHYKYEKSWLEKVRYNKSFINLVKYFVLVDSYDIDEASKHIAVSVPNYTGVK